MDSLNIRRVDVLEVEELRQISITTFTETFAKNNSEANMQQYLNDALSVEKLAHELSQTDSEFYFVLVDNHIAGYLKVNFGAQQTELHNLDAVEIERIYVLQQYHGKQVGQQLFNRAISVACQRNAPYLWLGVWEENHRAIAFYKKYGCTVFDKHVFVLGDDRQTDILMKLML